MEAAHRRIQRLVSGEPPGVAADVHDPGVPAPGQHDQALTTNVEHLQADHQARLRAQRGLIDILASRGRLREGLTPDEAAATYSALANPELFTLVTTAHGWSPEKYETWLADTLTLLLLSPA